MDMAIRAPQNAKLHREMNFTYQYLTLYSVNMTYDLKNQ